MRYIDNVNIIYIFANMNIQQFQYVLAVVDFKNFELAAQHCYVTQSTLSTMIFRFEDEIGIKIFNRKTRPVTITKEGEVIIDRLRILNNEFISLKSVIQELKGDDVGELRMGIIPTIAPYLLPLFLPTFAKQYPRIKIIIKEMTTHDIVLSLKRRTLDVGLLALPIEDSELVEREMFKEPFLVYDCSKREKPQRYSTNSIDYSKLWLLQEGHCLRTQVYHICEQAKLKMKHNVNFEFESGSMDSLLRFTKANNGQTIIPFLASLDFPKEEKTNIVKFNKPAPARSVGLITHKFFVKKKLTNKLAEIIKDAVLSKLPKNEETLIIKPL